jgi:hypothetical protein
MHSVSAEHSISAQECPGLGTPTVTAETSSVLKVSAYCQTAATRPMNSIAERIKRCFLFISYCLLFLKSVNKIISQTLPNYTFNLLNLQIFLTKKQAVSLFNPF